MRHPVPIREGAAPAAAAILAALFLALATASGRPVMAQGPTASPEPLPVLPPETQRSTRDWPVPQGDLKAHRAAADSAITSQTVDDLGVAWTFEITTPGLFGSATADPIVVRDTVYMQDMQSNVYALDRGSGDLRWRAALDTGTIGPNGVAVAYGRVFATLGDRGAVVALDADNGHELWRTRIGSPPGEGVDMAPIVRDGTVYVSTVPGTGLGSFYQTGDRGVLYALDVRTGEVEWWWDTTDGGFGVPGAAGGGGAWYPPSFDDAGNIYLGIGNPAPWPLSSDCANGACRPGPNLYTSSMVSLDPTTGAVRWFYQDRPHDLLDLDFQNTPVLLSADLDGVERELAIGSGKSGRVVAVDAGTGEVVWSTAVGRHQNDDLAELPLDEAIETFPGSLGGIETPIATDGSAIYAAYLDLPQYQSGTGPDPDRSASFASGSGGLAAIDVRTGSILWDAHLDTLPVAAATVANDLVFVGGIDGVLRAFDTSTGEQVWSHEAALGLNAPPAISGDMLFIAAGFPKTPHASGDAAGSEQPSAQDENGPTPRLIATRLGAAQNGAAASQKPERTREPRGTGSPEPRATPGPTATPNGTSKPTARPEPSGTPEPTNEPSPAPSGGTVRMVDFAFRPSELTIDAGKDVTIELANQGLSIHSFVIEELDVDSGLIDPGGNGTVTIHAAKGTYRFYCAVPGHREAGMVGTLTVR